MKKVLLFTTIILLINCIQAKSNGPFLVNKLTPPEKNETQTLQKRSFIWIEGQWETINNEYHWKSGHWTTKRIGYIYINGQWGKKNNGWQWTDGYWQKIDIDKWMTLHG